MPIFGFLSMLSFAAKQKLKSSYSRGSIMRPYAVPIPILTVGDSIDTRIPVGLACAIVDCMVCPACLSYLHSETCDHCKCNVSPILDEMELQATEERR